MAYNRYDKGDLVRVSTGTNGFTDAISGDPLDPDTVKFSYKTPSGTVTTLTYGPDEEIVKDATGKYHVDLDANEAGFWWYRWHSEGNGQAADESRFQVWESQTV